MDRRLHDRYPVNLDATVTNIAVQDHVAPGRIVDISQAGVCALLSLELATGSIVKVQIGDSALFGQVTYCNREGESLRTGIEVVRVLIGESDLSRVVNAMLAELLPRTPGIRAAR